MSDHLAALGIGSASREERQSQVRKILRDSVPQSHRPDGITLRWSDSSGAELWVHVDTEGEMKSVQPHFGGGPRIPMEIQAVVARPEVSPFDGGFVGLAASGGAASALGAFPVVFDTPDFVDCREVALASHHHVELAGFVLEVRTYPTEEALREAQPEMAPLPVPAFIPAGMVGQMEGKAPTAHALLVGRLLEGERASNELTGREFIRLQVGTPAGPLDLVADPSLLESIPEKGSIIQVGAWMSGRLFVLDED